MSRRPTRRGPPDPPGQSFTAAGQTLRRVAPARSAPTKVWAEDPHSGQRRDLRREEEYAFRAFAAKAQRATGIRIEELTNTVPPQPGPVSAALHRRDRAAAADRPVQDRRRTAAAGQPGTRRCALRDRLPVRDRNGAIPLVAATTAANAPGRRRGRGCSSAATASNTARYRAGHPRHAHRRARPHRADRPRHRRPLRFTPHDFRRLFITDAILGGLPPHVAQVIAGHRDINSPSVTMPSTPTKRSRPTWPSSSAGELRPGEEYRVPSRLGRHNLFGVATGAAEVRTAASTDSSIG